MEQHNLGIRSVHWNRLISEIKSQKLIPILGPELLTTCIDGEHVPFYKYIASQVVENFGMELPEGTEINQVSDAAYLYRKQQGDILDVYYYTHELLKSQKWELPPSLLQLAEIKHLDLFVTTTPDNLMAEALNKVRFGGVSGTRVLSYSPQTELEDLPDAYGKDIETVPTVFKMFGDAEMKPDFAITEEDALRYIHHLQFKDQRPANLFDVFRSRSLMLLGCGFENWQIRFFLCTAKGDAVFGSQGVRGVIANESSRNDSPLLPFLARNRTLLYQNGDGNAFIDELKWRYEESGLAKEAPETTISTIASNTDTSPAPSSVPDHEESSNTDVVFISYAREDGAAAENIRSILEQNGIRAWMDHSRIEGGDQFELQISEQIQACKIFLPVISKNTTTADKRYYRLEWKLALEESRKWPDTYPFIQPVAVDETTTSAPHLPQEFTKRHWHRYPDGKLEANFPKKLIRMLERYKQRALLG